MKTPENSPSREAEKPKDTGDVSNDILSQIRLSEQQEKLAQQQREEEKSNKLNREREEYKRGIDKLREQYTTIIEIINDPNWIDVDKLKKYAPQIPPDVFVLVKQINGDTSRANSTYQRTEVKFLKQELRGRVEELLELNLQTLRDIGVKLVYRKRHVSGSRAGSTFSFTEEYSFKIRDSI